MEFSQPFKATCSLPSSDGTLVASISSGHLVIRSTTTLDVERTVNLGANFIDKLRCMRWSPTSPAASRTSACGVLWKRRSGIDNSDEEGTKRQRVLLADEENIRVFDSQDEKWHALITQGFGGIRNVEFGRNEDELLVFSEFQLKLTVWNLLTSKPIEIPHPKFSTKGFGYRPFTSHFAILTRESTHDVVSIHQNTSYRLATSFTLPTMDAQGLKWSPCGRWLAVWDSAAAGYKVLVYTADGHLFRTHEKPCEGLGVKSVEWSPSSDFLTIGSYDGRLCFLSNYTFSPVISMNHTRTVQLPGVTVWSETAIDGQVRRYDQVPQPCTLPTVAFNSSDPQPKIGISTMEFNNPDGTLVATKNDSMPSTVWIWSLKLLRPYAVLVHLNPVKYISWHPTISDLLLIQCAGQGGESGQGDVIYLWSSGWKQPRVVQIPFEKTVGNTFVKWVLTVPPSALGTSSTGSTAPAFINSPFDRRSNSPEKDEHRPMFVYGDKEKYLIGYVEDELLPDELDDAELAIDTELDELVDVRTSTWGQVDWSRSLSHPGVNGHIPSPTNTKKHPGPDSSPELDNEDTEEETYDFRPRKGSRHR